jgi:hypothetical protein
MYIKVSNEQVNSERNLPIVVIKFGEKKLYRRLLLKPA